MKEGERLHMRKGERKRARQRSVEREKGYTLSAIVEAGKEGVFKRKGKCLP